MSSIDKIIISKDRKHATIYFNYDRPAFSLYSSEGHVLELLDFMLCPVGYSSKTEYDRRLQSSLEDTAIINIEDLEKVS